ncbi:hypothetical protein D9M72_236990 [compost metagenome]
MDPEGIAHIHSDKPRLPAAINHAKVQARGELEGFHFCSFEMRLGHTEVGNMWICFMAPRPSGARSRRSKENGVGVSQEGREAGLAGMLSAWELPH